jgi:hypothetical protein
VDAPFDPADRNCEATAEAELTLRVIPFIIRRTFRDSLDRQSTRKESDTAVSTVDKGFASGDKFLGADE